MIITKSKKLNFDPLEMVSHREKNKEVEVKVVVESENMIIKETADVFTDEEFEKLIAQLREFHSKKRYISYLKYNKGLVVEVEDY